MRVRLGLGAAVVLLILALVVAVVVSASAQQGSTAAIEAGAGADSPTGGFTPVPHSSAGGDAGLLVHVLGAVQRPGLVEVAQGARVVDAIAASGGLREDADPGAVNLARPVSDGEQLYVSRVGEAPPAGAGSAGGGAVGGGEAAGLSGSGTVDLNRATQAELETLPRIGPALAQRILEWKAANGRFAAVTDLMKVGGIGPKLFDGLKDRVRV